MVIKIRNPEDGSVSRIECTEIRYCLNPGTVIDGIPEKYHAAIEMNLKTVMMRTGQTLMM